MKSHAYSYTYIISESKNIQNLVQLDQFGTFETFASANNTQFMLKFSVERGDMIPFVYCDISTYIVLSWLRAILRWRIFRHI
uniref:Uncharacterized protein n=1 Tax=Onchocerca volvulus TaxID=6282 RepID=A0A8R1U1A5_ONCVO